MLPGSITAAIVTESWFSLPGLGKLIVNGASDRDYTLVLGLVVLVTVHNTSGENGQGSQGAEISRPVSPSLSALAR